MQYHQTDDNLDMTDSIDIPAVQPLILPDHYSQIKQIRQFLLILICTCLGFAVVYLIMSIIGWAVSDGLYRRSERFQVVEASISILFYGFGLFVTLRSHQKGLRVFGWLGIILSIISVIVLIVFHLIRAKLFFKLRDNIVWLVFTYITFIINIWFHLFAITVIIIKFSFQLARLMGTSGQFNTRQV
ncbi:hypothetical protein I4U23_022839 [Adineta vaga]|nr:hypothetical protein I4U23_022839 [Adineta vaga]